ncbi:MAG: ABC transporter substrate-binding protein [bacterium]|nr:ABC transporter substrate-binding protein [bacterium]
MPSRKQLSKLPKVLSKKERHIVIVLAFIALGALIAMPVTAYFHFTEPVPDFGGTFNEGLVGAPKQVNPILAQVNDVDRDIAKLVYSGLTKYDSEGNLIMDFAESYEISDDGLTYTFKLKEGVFWHDGNPLTADDVVFTILTVQNPEYNSLQAINWQGVEVSKVDPGTISFKLKNKYAQFLSNTTLGIIPKHIWEGVKPVNFSLSEFNTKPIGSGPYKFQKFRRDEFGNIQSYHLEAFKDYYSDQPFIKNIVFKFYLSERDVVDALNNGDIDGLAMSNRQVGLIKFRQKVSIKELQLPRYFSIFFDQNQSDSLSDANVRMALNYATDKNQVVGDVLGGRASVVSSPLLSGVLNIGEPSVIYDFDIAKAEELLDKSGWIYAEGEEQNQNSIRHKESGTKGSSEEQEPLKLEIELTTSDWPELVAVANEIKSQWQKVGVGVNLQILPLAQLQQTIKERKYEALLFGEVLSLDPDPFSFWHSSQKKDPGLNLALYDDKNADKLLEEARQAVDAEQRRAKYEEFQDLLLKSAPAVFVYSPDFIYVQSNKIRNNNSRVIAVPSERFGLVNEWYIDTRRVRKQ